MSQQVRQSHARRLMGDAESIPEILHGEVAVALGLLQERHRVRLRHQARRGVVVDLQALLEEVGVVGGGAMTEQAVGHRLQRHRSQPVTTGDGRRGKVDAAVLQVGDGARGVGKVVDVDQFETQLRGHDAHRAVGEGPRGVAGGLQLLLGELFDVGQVVVARPHPQSQLGVRPPRLLRRRCGLALPALQFPVQTEHRLQSLVRHGLGHPDRRDAQLPENVTGLGAFQLDLQRCALAGRLRRQQVRDLDPGGGCDLLQEGQLGLALAVLDQAEMASGDTDTRAELVQGHPAGEPEVADAVTQGLELHCPGGHSFSIAKVLQLFRPRSAARSRPD